MQKRALKLAPLTDKQRALVEEIRKKWIDPFQYEDIPVAFTVTQAIAQIIDAISRNAEQSEFLNILEVLKYSYLTLFGDQYMRALIQIFGDIDTVNKVLVHVNSRSIINRILVRMGKILPGMTIPLVEIDDILEDEGFST